jgi:peroxiredoxin (alkyl hydroperoxide reductase subunit C)
LSHQISKDYGVLLDDGLALRGTFIIDKNQVIRHIGINDLPVGRNVDEVFL